MTVVSKDPIKGILLTHPSRVNRSKIPDINRQFLIDSYDMDINWVLSFTNDQKAVKYTISNVEPYDILPLTTLESQTNTYVYKFCRVLYYYSVSYCNIYHRLYEIVIV